MNIDYIKFVNQLPAIPNDTSIEDYCKTLRTNVTDLVYIAAPYYHPNVEVKIARAQTCKAILDSFHRHMVLALSPIGKTGAMDIRSPDDTNWLDIDLRTLKVCKQLLVVTLPGMLQSPGLAVELGFAKANSMPIHRITPYHWTKYISNEQLQILKAI